MPKPPKQHPRASRRPRPPVFNRADTLVGIITSGMKTAGDDAHRLVYNIPVEDEGLHGPEISIIMALIKEIDTTAVAQFDADEHLLHLELSPSIKRISRLDLQEILGALKGLVKDCFVEKNGNYYFIPQKSKTLSAFRFDELLHHMTGHDSPDVIYFYELPRDVRLPDGSVAGAGNKVTERQFDSYTVIYEQQNHSPFSKEASPFSKATCFAGAELKGETAKEVMSDLGLLNGRAK